MGGVCSNFGCCGTKKYLPLSETDAEGWRSCTWSSSASGTTEDQPTDEPACLMSPHGLGSETTQPRPLILTVVEQPRCSSSPLFAFSSSSSKPTENPPRTEFEKKPRLSTQYKLDTRFRSGSSVPTEHQSLLKTKVYEPWGGDSSECELLSLSGSCTTESLSQLDELDEFGSLYEDDISCSSSGSETTEADEPWYLSPNELETWFLENITNGLEAFDIDCRKVIDNVVRHIHQNNGYFKVDKIIKGGSLGKKTMLEEFSDVDLVVFVNRPALAPISEYWSPDDYTHKLRTVIEDLTDSLCELPSVTITRKDNYLVNFDMQVGARSVSVDLLPTANNDDNPDVYSEMMNQAPSQRNYYSASFVEKQRDFVLDQPDEVKDLIRMVKYWAYTRLPKHLQKSYPLELITIYSWEEAGEPEHFSKVSGLKAVLEVIGRSRWKRMKFWVNYYSKDMALDAIETMKYPVLLDPANPTNNVLYVYHQGDNMKEIKDAARTTLKTPLLRNAYSLL